MLTGQVVGGVPHDDEDHAQHVANFALLVQHVVSAVKNPVTGEPLLLRMGIHSGPAVAGVVGSL